MTTACRLTKSPSQLAWSEVGSQWAVFYIDCFATSEPTLWNSLPEQLRPLDITFGQFK